MSLHVIVTGGPVQGCRIFGPFQQIEDAIEYAEMYCSDDLGSWEIAPLEAKEEIR